MNRDCSRSVEECAWNESHVNNPGKRKHPRSVEAHFATLSASEKSSRYSLNHPLSGAVGEGVLNAAYSVEEKTSAAVGSVAEAAEDVEEGLEKKVTLPYLSDHSAVRYR